MKGLEFNRSKLEVAQFLHGEIERCIDWKYFIFHYYTIDGKPIFPADLIKVQIYLDDNRKSKMKKAVDKGEAILEHEYPLSPHEAFQRIISK